MRSTQRHGFPATAGIHPNRRRASMTRQAQNITVSLRSFWPFSRSTMARPSSRFQVTLGSGEPVAMQRSLMLSPYQTKKAKLNLFFTMTARPPVRFICTSFYVRILRAVM